MREYQHAAEHVENCDARVIKEALWATHGDVRLVREVVGIPRTITFDKHRRHGIHINELGTGSRADPVGPPR